MGNSISNMNCNIFSTLGGANRNTQQQKALSNDLLRQNEEERQQHGGPLLDALIAFLSLILPCCEALLGRLMWVLLWSWKAAPVALYESFLRRQPTTEGASDTTKSFLQGGTDVSQYFQKWWQKTVVVPTAMGFYYFLYDYVSEPILASVGCCSSPALTTIAGVGLLVAHFISGVALHLWQQRKANQEKLPQATEEVEFSNQQQSSPSPNRTLDNHQDHQDWVTMEKAHAAATGAITDYQAAHNNDTTVNNQLPSPQALFNSVKEKKRKFWPFGKRNSKSSSNKNKFQSNAPPATEMV